MAGDAAGITRWLVGGPAVVVPLPAARFLAGQLELAEAFRVSQGEQLGELAPAVVEVVSAIVWLATAPDSSHGDSCERSHVASVGESVMVGGDELSTAEVAVMIDRCEPEVRRLARAGALPCRVTGRGWRRYRRADVEAFIEGRGSK